MYNYTSTGLWRIRHCYTAIRNIGEALMAAMKTGDYILESMLTLWLLLLNVFIGWGLV